MFYNLRLNFYSYTIFFAGVEDYDHRESYLTINFTNKTIDSLTLNSSDDKYFTVVASNNLPHLILVREFNIPPSVNFLIGVFSSVVILCNIKIKDIKFQK